MSKPLYFLHAVGGHPAACRYLAQLAGAECMRRLIGEEWKELYSCPAGFHNVDDALRKFGPNIEVYEGVVRGRGVSGLARYDPTVKLERRRSDANSRGTSFSRTRAWRQH